uniref:CAA303714.1 protein n=1 Tax=Oryza sativa TaxID=4530 RepID=Q9ST83_ORYSA|nr:CAA303714.1 protein [Oryza sativa]
MDTVCEGLMDRREREDRGEALCRHPRAPRCRAYWTVEEGDEVRSASDRTGDTTPWPQTKKRGEKVVPASRQEERSFLRQAPSPRFPSPGASSSSGGGKGREDIGGDEKWEWIYK